MRGFNDWFLVLHSEMGCREVVLLHPEKKSRVRTDRRDADQFGELLWVNRTRPGRRPFGARPQARPMVGTADAHPVAAR